MTPPLPFLFLFDLDGTLVDSLPDIAASTNFVREHHGLPAVPLHEVRSYIGDGLLELLHRALAPVLERESADVFDAAVALYRDHHVDQCTRLVRPYPGVTEHLAAWQADGRPLAVVTNKPERFAQLVVNHLGLDRWLTVIVGGDTTDQHKPGPAPVWAALDQLGSGRDRGMMIGDSVGDVHAGKAAGIRTAAVTYGYRAESDLRAADADEYWTHFGAGHGP